MQRNEFLSMDSQCVCVCMSVRMCGIYFCVKGMQTVNKKRFSCIEVQVERVS